jgi:choline-sulfatase
MKKYAVVISLLLAAVLVIWKSGWWASSSSPNIVLIIIDALRADCLGCYGFKKDISPEIDKMAHKGVLFENVIAQCSWTRPSIGSMITSRYPRSIGIYKEKFDILADKNQTLAEILKENGYITIGITANPNINSVFNFHQGFDDYTDSSVIWNWMKSEPGTKKIQENVHLPKSKEVFDVILGKVKKLEKKKSPVYIQVNIMEVHSPYLTRDEYKRLFQDCPPLAKNKYYPAEELSALVTGTYSAVRQSSHDIDDFIKRLLSIPGWENTLFIITSDHGQGLDDHPDIPKGIAHGYLLYESQLKVPLILYQPNAKKNAFKNKRIKQWIQLLDLMPTVLDYIGIAPPKNIQGRSVLDLIVKDISDSQLPVYFFAETNLRETNKIAVYNDKWKYIENYDHWQGVNVSELQPMGIKENGKLTDKIHDNPATAKKLKQILSQWQGKNPKVKEIQPSKKPGKKETDQLKSLGYLK